MAGSVSHWSRVSRARAGVAAVLRRHLRRNLPAAVKLAVLARTGQGVQDVDELRAATDRIPLEERSLGHLIHLAVRELHTVGHRATQDRLAAESQEFAPHRDSPIVGDAVPEAPDQSLSSVQFGEELTALDVPRGSRATPRSPDSVFQASVPWPSAAATFMSSVRQRDGSSRRK